MAKSAILILGVLALVVWVRSARLIIYDEPFFQKPIFNRNVTDRCTEMPPNVHDRASSVNTNGSCVYLYEHWGCQGRRVRFEPGSPSHDNLDDLKFNNMASSMRACCPPIPGPYDCGSSRFFVQTAKLRLFDKYDYEDLIWEGAPTEECTSFAINVPWAQTMKRASSVDTLGTCVELYEDFRCMDRKIVLRPGSPHHDNLGNLGFDNMAGSVRACCDQRSWSNGSGWQNPYPYGRSSSGNNMTSIMQLLAPNNTTTT